MILLLVCGGGWGWNGITLCSISFADSTNSKSVNFFSSIFWTIYVLSWVPSAGGCYDDGVWFLPVCFQQRLVGPALPRCEPWVGQLPRPNEQNCLCNTFWASLMPWAFSLVPRLINCRSQLYTSLSLSLRLQSLSSTYSVGNPLPSLPSLLRLSLAVFISQLIHCRSPKHETTSRSNSFVQHYMFCPFSLHLFQLRSCRHMAWDKLAYLCSVFIKSEAILRCREDENKSNSKPIQSFF